LVTAGSCSCTTMDDAAVDEDALARREEDLDAREDASARDDACLTAGGYGCCARTVAKVVLGYAARTRPTRAGAGEVRSGAGSSSG
jgi:hypothetical protein